MYKKFPNLDDITTNFDYNNLQNNINSINEDYLYPSIDNLINVFIENYYYAFIDTNFNIHLMNNINDIIFPTLQELNNTVNILFNYNDIKPIIVDRINDFYNNLGVPHRQQPFTTELLPCNYEHNKNQIEYLTSLQQSEQKSETWHIERSNKLTASNIWKAIDTEASINSLIVEKCRTYTPIPLNINSPKHHGEKYEPLSVIYYEYTYNTKIGEFGFIDHKYYKFLGASPDGIIIDSSSNLFGRMIEIKNIVNREINGIPKKEYWTQMQIQMEVCDLDYCDFLETEFKEYLNEEEFLNDGTFKKTKDGFQKGIFIKFNNTDGTPFYQYPPWNIGEEKFNEWEIQIMEKYSQLTWVQNFYWKLIKVSLVTITRNHFWYNSCHDKFKKVHAIIQKEKISGYEHRLPKKRVAKTTTKNTNKNVEDKVIITIDTN
jgi:hypothetical protein